jgi:hypothetical protein
MSDKTYTNSITVPRLKHLVDQINAAEVREELSIEAQDTLDELRALAYNGTRYIADEYCIDDDDGPIDPVDYPLSFRYMPSKRKPKSAAKTKPLKMGPEQARKYSKLKLLAAAFEKLKMMALPKLTVTYVSLENMSRTDEPGVVSETQIQFENWSALESWLVTQPMPSQRNDAFNDEGDMF